MDSYRKLRETHFQIISRFSFYCSTIPNSKFINSRHECYTQEIRLSALIKPSAPRFHSFQRIFTCFLISPSVFSHPLLLSASIFFIASAVVYLHDDGSHVSLIRSLFHRPGVYKWTSERTSKKSVSFNHAGTGKLNYPGGWLATRTPDMERVERREEEEEKKIERKNGRAQASTSRWVWVYRGSFIEQIR